MGDRGRVPRPRGITQRVEPAGREAVDRATHGDVVALEQVSNLGHDQAAPRESYALQTQSGAS